MLKYFFSFFNKIVQKSSGQDTIKQIILMKNKTMSKILPFLPNFSSTHHGLDDLFQYPELFENLYFSAYIFKSNDC